MSGADVDLKARAEVKRGIQTTYVLVTSHSMYINAINKCAKADGDAFGFF